MKASKVEDRDWVTRTNEYRYKDAKRFVDNYENDPKAKERKSVQECKDCTYHVGFAGQAFTPSQCIRCGCGLMHPNTDVDVLCLTCARDIDSCKHCGGAMD